MTNAVKPDDAANSESIAHKTFVKNIPILVLGKFWTILDEQCEARCISLWVRGPRIYPF